MVSMCFMRVGLDGTSREERAASTCSRLGGAVLCGGARVSGRGRHPGCDQCLREVGGASAPACLRAWTELDRTNLSHLLLFSPFLWAADGFSRLFTAAVVAPGFVSPALGSFLISVVILGFLHHRFPRCRSTSSWSTVPRYDQRFISMLCCPSSYPVPRRSNTSSLFL
ncbi:hypothetical protein DFH08DRAFT_492212 [Mycena albidolilacea]|uniref:Uncharacterized protein n=1 Tax=Mycena albidolilacea TaxID=1033008 RepID=A0AAD6Z4U5_9AGAR|nr:hypothetical protein DFH08DRAFT_492212 [Mycena albidolilacea]